MKLEHQVTAPRDGRIDAVQVSSRPASGAWATAHHLRRRKPRMNWTPQDTTALLDTVDRFAREAWCPT
jgi:hypothetical protein